MSPGRAGDHAGLLLAAGQAVDVGAGILRQGYSHVGVLISKRDRDFRTDLDPRIQTPIRASLAKDTAGSWVRSERLDGRTGATLLGA